MSCGLEGLSGNEDKDNNRTEKQAPNIVIENEKYTFFCLFFDWQCLVTEAAEVDVALWLIASGLIILIHV